MSDNFVSITPDTSILLAAKNANLGWSRIVGELVDNSFDAFATHIELDWTKKKRFAVTDNGCGCDNPIAFFRNGEHKPHSGEALGRYGVGVKDAGQWLWGTTKIKTSTKEKTWRQSVTWQLLADSGNWSIKEAEQCSKAESTGTQIEFFNIDRQTPRGQADWDRIVADLSFTFMPALLSGRQIVVKQLAGGKVKEQTVAPFTPPLCAETREVKFNVNGRGVILQVGIVDEGEKNPRPGFAYIYKHRVIFDSALGCGQFSPARIFGKVVLDKSWPLTRNKDDISDHRAKDELGKAIESHAHDLLERAHSQSMLVKSAAFDNTVNAMLAAAAKSLAAKAKRGKGNSSGTAAATGNGSKHRNARRKQRGQRMLSEEQLGRLRIEWKPFDEDTFGTVDINAPLIWMNQSDPSLAMYRNTENTHAIITTAMGMYVHAAVEQGQPQRYFPGFRDCTESSFFPWWSMVLRSVMEASDA